MGISFYPYHTHLSQNVIRRVHSEHTGICQSLLVSPARHPGGLRIKSVTGQMPHYHKILLDPGLNVQYHLAGYGIFFEEAIVRYVGESIERYSSIACSRLYEELIQFGTVNELQNRSFSVPFELLSIFSEEDCNRIGIAKARNLKPLQTDDVLGWLPCHSLFSPTSKVWVPAQVLFSGYKVNQEKKEVSFLPSFSTGTAAHTSFEGALLNAILECLQIDALMVYWYTSSYGRELIVDNFDLADIIGVSSEYKTQFVDISSVTRSCASIIVTSILNNAAKRPLIVCGSHADLSPLKAAYRSLMEARAIMYLAAYGPLFLPSAYFPSDQKIFADLDSNVAFYADPQDSELKVAAIRGKVSGKQPLASVPDGSSGDVSNDLKTVINSLKGISKLASFVDVTPPEVRESGWYVVRVCIPELITMCLPGIPYSRHPRFHEFGGITNDLPHPLP